MSGKITPLPAPPRRYSWPRFSPDGKKISVIIQEGEIYSTWVVDLTTSVPRRLTHEGNTRAVPLWMPDGRTIVFNSDRSGTGEWKLYQKAADGSGEAELFYDAQAGGHEGFDPYSWDSEGKILVGYGRMEPDAHYSGIPGKGGAILSLDLNDSSRLKEIVPGHGDYEKYNPVLSPTGPWLAYVSDESGQWEVYLTPFPGPGETRLVSNQGGLRPLWSPDGKQLFYYQPKEKSDSDTDVMMVVDIRETPDPDPSVPRRLFSSPAWGGDHYPYANWDISPDGTSFIMTRFVEQSSRQKEPRIKVILNFFSELIKKVPGK
jgi:Tol biopolymer transport system component